VDLMRRRRPDVPLEPAMLDLLEALGTEDAEPEPPPEVEDDRLRLLFTVCHPALAPAAQVALALRTLCGLTTSEIARAHLEPEATTAQRLVRAKRKIAEAGIPFEVPAADRLAERLDGVLSTIYLVFNEGFSATEGESWLRPDLCAEAIRLGRLVVELLPDAEEAEGLLALMLLHDARRPARTAADGTLVPLEEQDRTRWDRAGIVEGTAVLDRAVARGRAGPYQLQAAVAMAHGPEAGLAWMDRLERSGALDGYHLLPASQADLLRRLGRTEEARAAYRRALALVRHPAERRFLERRLAELGEP
jgi:RNA polymerase sigma-70 factor (ECF subfamily)